MAILNYTTKINAHKTASEIQMMLAKRGVKSVNIDYDGQGNPVGLMFFILIREAPVNFRLPSNYEGVLKVLERDRNVPKSYRTKEQALRVSWRIIKDWVEAQIAIIDAEIAKMEEVFLPYAVTNNGETLFQRFENEGQKLLA